MNAEKASNQEGFAVLSGMQILVQFCGFLYIELHRKYTVNYSNAFALLGAK